MVNCAGRLSLALKVLRPPGTLVLVRCRFAGDRMMIERLAVCGGSSPSCRLQKLFQGGSFDVLYKVA